MYRNQRSRVRQLLEKEDLGHHYINSRFFCEVLNESGTILNTSFGFLSFLFLFFLNVMVSLI